MLASALRRYISNSAFQDLQETLLHAFTGYVPGDGTVFTFPCDLIDLIDVDNTFFCALDVIVTCLKESHKHVFNVFTDVTCFSQGRCVRDRERNAEDLSQGLDQVSLTGTGRSDQQNIALLKLNIRIIAAPDPLVVVVNSHGELSLGPVLTNHILIQEIDDLAGPFQSASLKHVSHVFLLFSLPEAGENIIGRLDAVLTDDGAAASDEAFTGRFRFSAK